MATRPLMLTALAVLAAVLLSGVSAQDCSGMVGSYVYDLTPLAMALNWGAVNATDPYWGRIFWYYPCNSNYMCPSNSLDMTAAVCERFINNASAAFDAGNRGYAFMRPLPNQEGNSGFQLYFLNGTNNRSSIISFFCDPYEAPGTFEYMHEAPTNEFHFQYRTKYACPIYGPSTTPYPTYDPTYTPYPTYDPTYTPYPTYDPTYTPYPTYDPTYTPYPTWDPYPSASPQSDNLCCLYMYNNDQTVAKTLCTSYCPSYIQNYTFSGSWSVTSCADCFFHK